MSTAMFVKSVEGRALKSNRAQAGNRALANPSWHVGETALGLSVCGSPLNITTAPYIPDVEKPGELQVLSLEGQPRRTVHGAFGGLH